MTRARRAPQETAIDARQPVRTVVVTSGKGGVGKTSVVVNLAVALARQGERVTLLDADYGLGKIDIFLGLDTQWTFEHVLRGSRALSEVLVGGPEGIRILPASTGVQDLTRLTSDQQLRLRAAIAELAGSTDLLLVDTATGISDNVVFWLKAATEVLVVTSPDPAAIVDAYAVLKLIAALEPRRSLAVVVNNVIDEDEATTVYERLSFAVKEFLGCELQFFGHVLRDPLLAEAVKRRLPVVTFLPDSPSSRCFDGLARHLLEEPATPDAEDRFTAIPVLVPAGE